MVTAAVLPTVRRADDGDVPLLIELRRAWCAENARHDVEADAAFVEEFTAWHARESEQRVTWIAEVGGEAVGMLNLLEFRRMPVPTEVASGRAPHWGYIANVFVRATYRDQAIGRRLLDAAVTYADERGYAQLLLSPSERSVPFYRRAGFVTPTRHLVRPAPHR